MDDSTKSETPKRPGSVPGCLKNFDLNLLENGQRLRGVFSGIQADVQDKSRPEYRRREPAQIDARRRQLGG